MLWSSSELTLVDEGIRRHGRASDASPPPPQLPAEVHAVLARLALAAHGGDMDAWLRFRSVCRAWRDALVGEQRLLQADSFRSSACHRA